MSVAELKLVGRLATAHALRHPGRIMLTALSTIASACVVVWVVSGYDAVIGQFGSFSEGYMGRYDLYVLTSAGSGFGMQRGTPINREIVEALRKDPAVAVVDTNYETRARVRRPGGDKEVTPRGGPGRGPQQPASGPHYMGGLSALKAQSRSPQLVGSDATDAPHRILSGKWFNSGAADRKEAAITHDSAESLGVMVGDELLVSGGGDEAETTLHIVAILEQPTRLPPPKFMIGLPPSRDAALRGGPAGNAVFVPLALAEKITGTTASASNLAVMLKSGVNSDDFVAAWAPKLAAAKPPLEVRSRDKVETEADNSSSMAGVRAQAYSALGISLLAALFIIFTTLSMGVHERIRQFAVLRAVALTKWQIALLIGCESLLLGLIGWGGGLLAGWGLLKMMAATRPASVADGAVLGHQCVVLSGVCAVGGALLASILPAWRATSVSPLEAMAPQSRSLAGGLSWKLMALGLVLVILNPVLVFWVPMPDTARYGISAALGCTAMAIGFILLTPAFVLMAERVLSPILSRVLALNSRLLATQLSANMWRTVGVTIALTLGLGLFVAMQIWGYSMLGPFTPGDWSPDLIVSIAPVGVPDDQIDAVRHVKGVRADQFVPLAVKHVKFAEDILGFKVRPSATRQDSCIMVGVDPQAAFDGKHPLFDFDFVEGTHAQALEKLATGGRYCIVPDHFARDSGLGVGGKFAIVPPNHADSPIEYEIAGVVSMPGWHWMTKMGFRRGRAGALIFSPFETVRKDLDTGRSTLFWMNLDGTASEEAIKADMETIARKNYDSSLVQRESRGEFGPPEMDAAPAAEVVGEAGGEPSRRGPGGGFGRRSRGPGVTLRSREGVRTEIRGRADNIIWELGKLPLVTVMVTSLGVVNTVLSSIRSRRWDLGVLRSLGLTRFGLFRLIIAEVLLIGAVACVLSLAFGIMAGYCGVGVTRYVNIRGGQFTPLIIPWAKLAVGFALTIGLCLLAALWPAAATGRAEPLRLLQAGRSSG